MDPMLVVEEQNLPGQEIGMRHGKHEAMSINTVFLRCRCSRIRPMLGGSIGTIATFHCMERYFSGACLSDRVVPEKEQPTVDVLPRLSGNPQHVHREETKRLKFLKSSLTSERERINNLIGVK